MLQEYRFRTAFPGASSKAMKSIVLMVCASGFFCFLFAQTKGAQRLSASEAKDHMGQVATVCGKVVAAKISKYSVGERGKPITFDLDEPAPNRVFSFVSWSPDPAKVEQTKTDYMDKQVCVSGTITKIGTLPQIVVKDLSQISLADEKK